MIMKYVNITLLILSAIATYCCYKENKDIPTILVLTDIAFMVLVSTNFKLNNYE